MWGRDRSNICPMKPGTWHSRSKDAPIAAIARDLIVVGGGVQAISAMFTLRGVQRIIDLGISEIGLYYPTRDEEMPKFESIARNVIPNLRAKHADSL